MTNEEFQDAMLEELAEIRRHLEINTDLINSLDIKINALSAKSDRLLSALSGNEANNRLQNFLLRKDYD